MKTLVLLPPDSSTQSSSSKTWTEMWTSWTRMANLSSLSRRSNSNSQFRSRRCQVKKPQLWERRTLTTVSEKPRRTWTLLSSAKLASTAVAEWRWLQSSFRFTKTATKNSWRRCRTGPRSWQGQEMSGLFTRWLESSFPVACWNLTSTLIFSISCSLNVSKIQFLFKDCFL